MSHSSTPSFGWVGQFLGFSAGEKSPYQYLSMRVAATDSGQINSGELHQVSVGKSLRQMMVGYLVPQMWIRVVGKVKVDGRTGHYHWKAREIVGLSTQQAIEYVSQQKKEHASTPGEVPVAKPIRVLICQKSSCQQRGSRVVSDEVARAIAASSQSTQIQIQATGCMKQCSSGPHLVWLSAGKHKPQKYAGVTPQSANQIVHQMIETL